MINLFGIHYLLAVTPIWLTAVVIWLATDGAIHLMRDIREGLGYQVSYSAKFGDVALFIAVLIAVTILQRGDAYMPIVAGITIGDDGTQAVILMACISIGIGVSLMTLGKRSGQLADMYHDAIIAPAILFFAITLVPVIWCNARWYEGLAVIVAGIVWASLVRFDFWAERMNQRQWLINHGFAIKGEIPRH